MTYHVPERIIEAEILKSKGKLTGVRFVGTLVLGLAFLWMPATLVVVLVWSARHHEPIVDSSDGLFLNMFTIVGGSAVALGFGSFGYRLIRRAFSS